MKRRRIVHARGLQRGLRDGRQRQRQRHRQRHRQTAWREGLTKDFKLKCHLFHHFSWMERNAASSFTTTHAVYTTKQVPISVVFYSFSLPLIYIYSFLVERTNLGFVKQQVLKSLLIQPKFQRPITSLAYKNHLQASLFGWRWKRWSTRADDD